MAKFIQEDYGNTKEILKFPDHYVALAVTVDDEGILPNEHGKKIVPAGTILGGKTKPVIDNTDEYVVEKEGEDIADAEGVLFRDTDVTYGPASGALIIHGFIAQDKLPKPVTAEAKAALPQIHFIK